NRGVPTIRKSARQSFRPASARRWRMPSPMPTCSAAKRYSRTKSISSASNIDISVSSTLLTAHLHSLINSTAQAGHVANNYVARQLHVADGVIGIGQPVNAVSVSDNVRVITAVHGLECILKLLAL